MKKILTGLSDDSPGKESHRRQMRRYFERDLHEAKTNKVIIGVKIWARQDLHWAANPCPRAAQFAGVYLPDEVPELYPKDCPDENACCCVLSEMVLDCDNTMEALALRERLAQRGLPSPPPPWDYEKELAEVEQMEREKAARENQQKQQPVERSFFEIIIGLFTR